MGKDVAPESGNFDRHPLFLKVLGRYPDCPSPPAPPAAAEHWDESDFELFVATMGAIVPPGLPKLQGAAQPARAPAPEAPRPAAEQGPGSHQAQAPAAAPALGPQREAGAQGAGGAGRGLGARAGQQRRCPAAGSRSILRSPRGTEGPGGAAARPSQQIKRSVSFSEVVEEKAADPAGLEPEGRGRGGLADPRCVLAVLAMLVALAGTDAELQAACRGGISAALERLPTFGQALPASGIVPLVAVPLVLTIQVFLFAALAR